ncbi:MAG TPA: CDP-alcohol phosphatidyltransferase family protein [Thermomicrobiales bacterium]|jgi:CDP-diacylglycerol--glycerol-3-phosphate 3-phosphatidyltransferase|nr:CDP-alcohol phosphatidyltransferase family protein [Thermomicrobiales bacterium]
MANLITIGRLLLLYVVIWLIYVGNVQVITLCMFLVIVVFASDGLDGWVARKRQSTSTFGAVFDIAGDRIVENSLWVVFAHLDLIPIWVPLLVMGRGFIVDGLRSLSYGEGMTAFGANNMMRSAFTEWLTAGRFMRAVFGYAKAAGFVFLTGLVAERSMDTSGTVLGAVYGQDWVNWLGWTLVWGAVALTVIRGLPVIYDSLAFMREIDRRQAEARS